MLQHETETTVPISSAVLSITEKCNLNCSYCYTTKSNRSMDLSTAKKTVDMLLKEPLPPDKPIIISFFGGEPLIEFDLIKKVVSYATARGKEENRAFGFGFVSNMTLFNDEILAYLKAHNFSILASIDGSKQVHNGNRRFTDGQGSFESAIKNTMKVCNHFGNVHLRMTLSPNFIGKLTESIQFLDSIGPVCITLTPDVSADWEEVVNSGALDREYLKLANVIIEGFRRGRLPSLIPLSSYIVRYGASLINKPTQVQDQHTCRAGRYSIAVNPSGDILPCHQFDGLPNYYLGNCDSKIDFEKRKTFLNLSSESFKYCNNCDVYKLCSGPCVGVSATFEGGLYEPHKIFCDFSRSRAKAARYIHSTLTMEDNELFLKAMSHIETDKFPVCS